MKHAQNLGLIPSLMTHAGTCLTADNWYEVGINAVAVDLASLLFKPGFTLLSKLKKLSNYLGWEKTIVLNASLTQAKINRANDQYVLRSPYDGSILSYSLDEIILLIEDLQPDLVILPTGVMHQFKSEGITPFYSPAEQHSTQTAAGIYFYYDNKNSWSDFLATLQRHQGKMCFVAGDLGFEEIQELNKIGIRFIQSDLPAANACQGEIYTAQGPIVLSTTQYADDFELIDNQCSCPTCTQSFTRAYLHHLLAQTPLLCQRLLIQHNLHFCQTRLYTHTS